MITTSYEGSMNGVEHLQNNQKEKGKTKTCQENTHTQKKSTPAALFIIWSQFWRA